jgi:hypothetical protein
VRATGHFLPAVLVFGIAPVERTEIRHDLQNVGVELAPVAAGADVVERGLLRTDCAAGLVLRYHGHRPFYLSCEPEPAAKTTRGSFSAPRQSA